MKKKIVKKMAAVAMGVAVLGGGFVGNGGVVAKQLKTPVSAKTVQAKTRKPCTTVHKITAKLKDKGTCLGPGSAGVYPETTNWKSSNTKIATVSTKGDDGGGHKVKFKKKGTVTISCMINKTYGGVRVKGDVIKWVITIK